MFFLISGTVLFVGLSGTIGLVAYKIAHGIDEYEERSIVVSSVGSFSVLLRRKLDHLFTQARTIHFPVLVERTIMVCRGAARAIVKRYGKFRASMEGRGSIDQKGAVSFFLKTVAEHKKKLRVDR